MPKKQQSTRFEKHIYVENRSGALRFKVVFTPLQDSATFSTLEEGALWARRRRVELLEERAGAAKAQVSSNLIQLVPSSPNLQFSPKAWVTIKLPDVFDSRSIAKRRVATRNDRAALTGIQLVLKTRIPWEYLPRELGCGSGMTCWRRLHE